MKTKIVLILTMFSFLFSCNNAHNEAENHEENEHDHGNTQEGIVVLNEAQREALNLKTDTFMMRNLTTVVKTNGTLEVPSFRKCRSYCFYRRKRKKDQCFPWRQNL